MHAFKDQIASLKEEVASLETFTFYDTIENQNDASNQIIKGHVDLHKCKDSILLEEAKYYICDQKCLSKRNMRRLLI